MKRLVAVVVGGLLWVTTAWSAVPVVDVRVGVDAATLAGDIDQLFEPELQFGFTGGLHVTLPLSPVFGLESGLDWRMKGTHSEYEASDTEGNVNTYELDVDLRYLEVPLLVTLSPMPASQVRPVIALGAAFGFPISGEARFTEQPLFDQDLKDDMKSPDVGVQIGGGLLFPMGDRTGRIDLRYTHGVSDLYDLDDNVLESMNRAFSLTVGMAF